MKNKNGVTLIALAVTILVMTILTTTIVSSISNSGIIGKSKDTVGKANLIQAQELVTSAWTKAYMSHPNDYTYIKEKVNEALEKSGIDTDKYTAIINEDGAVIVARKDITTTLGSLITVNDYGKTVDYSVTVDGTTYSDWQIYYHNEEYVYLIATESIGEFEYRGISVNSLTTEELALYEKFRVGKSEKFLLSDNVNDESADNCKAVAQLIKDYAGFANTSDYGSNVVGAIGSPTIELFAAGWNRNGYEPTINIGIGTYGYMINNGASIEGIEQDGLYATGNIEYILASPVYVRSDIVFIIGTNYIRSDMCSVKFAVRPVVCLKGSIPAVKGTVTDYLLVN